MTCWSVISSVQGIRVEVNGEVLSQGGDVAADQVTDTTSAVSVLRNPAFLPSAISIGLQPGNPLEVRLAQHTVRQFHCRFTSRFVTYAYLHDLVILHPLSHLKMPCFALVGPG